MVEKKSKRARRIKKAVRTRSGSKSTRAKANTTPVDRAAAIESLRESRKRFLERVESSLMATPIAKIASAEIGELRAELIDHIRERIDRRRADREALTARIDQEIAHDTRLVEDLEVQAKLQDLTERQAKKEREEKAKLAKKEKKEAKVDVKAKKKSKRKRM